MNTKNKLITYFERWRHLGSIENSDGSVQLGPRPEISKFSYLLEIMPPLSKEDISAVERSLTVQLPAMYRTKIHSSLPEELKDFYRTANGFRAFVNRFGLLGNATSGPVMMRPWDIVSPNMSSAIRSVEKSKHRNERGLLLIKRYDDDANAFISITGECSVISAEGKLQRTFSNLESWILTEVERIGQYYDNEGRSKFDSLSHEIPSPGS